MLSHIPHALIYTGFVLLTPVVIGVVLWRFCDDEPRNEEPADDGEREREPDLGDLSLAA